MHLFICYAHTEKQFVKELSDILQTLDYSPWYDKDILAGQNWETRLFDEIDKCDAFIYVLSPESISSKWCRKEFNRALKQRKPVIPLLLQTTLDFKDSPQLKKYQYVEFTNGLTMEAFAQLARALVHLRASNKSSQKSDTQNAPGPEDKPAVTPLEHYSLDSEEDLRYFVSHSFSSEEAERFKKTVIEVFKSFRYASSFAEEDNDNPLPLFKKWKTISAARFGIFDISGNDPNVYLELGAAAGLNKQVVLLAHNDTSLPVIFEGHPVIRYNSFTDLKEKLDEFSKQDFLTAPQDDPDYCYFCNRTCSSLASVQAQNACLVLNSTPLLWNKVNRILEPLLTKCHFYPIYLATTSWSPPLCDIRRKVLSSKFIIAYPEMSNEISFFAFGMAISIGTPWLFLSSKDDKKAVFDLTGLKQEEYMLDLNSELDQQEEQNQRLLQLEKYLGLIVPPQKDGEFKPTVRTMNLWDNFFQPIVDRGARAAQGELHVIRYEGKTILRDRLIPMNRALKFGRNSARCDIVIESPTVSSEHFRIFRQGNDYVIEDMGSTTGTFLNNQRLTPGKREKITFMDNIRIMGAKFIIWDDSPPTIFRTSAPKQYTHQLTNEIHIDLPDIIVPDYLKTLDQSLLLSIDELDGNGHWDVHVQAYYPMEAILEKFLEEANRPKIESWFELNGKRLSGKTTPFEMEILDNTVLYFAQNKQARDLWDIQQIVNGMILTEVKSRIALCENDTTTSQTIDGVVSRIWPPGTVWHDTVQNLFRRLYKNTSGKELPIEVKIPAIGCPKCKKNLHPITEVGGLTALE